MLVLSEALPENFRIAQVLTFHRRDATEVAERVRATSIEKALLWNGCPALLEIRFETGGFEARLDATGTDLAGQARFRAMVRRMLGVHQDVAGFEARHAQHPLLGRLIERQRGLRVPAAATPFEALSWAVTGQQISLAAAVSVRRRLILAAGIRHACGLWCYPDASALCAMSQASLQQAGFSAAKARTLGDIAARIEARTLPLDEWSDALPDDAGARLLAIPGIGPWTADYTLLRGFGWLDGSLHGDAALRRALQALLGLPARPDIAATRAWLEAFSPWRALVGAHLWASLD